MGEWIRALRALGERRAETVLVTMTAGRGSTPREAGAKMVVTLDALHGTIGGGDVEYEATRVARAMLQSTGDRQAKRFPLGAALGQYCGGVADLLFERVPGDAPWVRVLAEWIERGDRCVLVTSEKGMEGDGYLLVRAGETFGSLGDRVREARATEVARRLLDGAEVTPTLVALGVDETAFFELVAPQAFDVVVFGAGHIGRALIRVLGALPCRVTWVDSRGSEFPPGAPENVRTVTAEAPVAEIANARAGSTFLVMTHSHALDLDLVEAILRRADAEYCGMIGSQTKRRKFEADLTARGLTPAAIARLTCPLGIDGLKGKDPGTIAVAVAATLLAHRERAAARKVALPG